MVDEDLISPYRRLKCLANSGEEEGMVISIYAR